ncbi:Matrix metalloproteinase-25 [Folsomia candida]|uniref:Matrix metalloproteinase-25 n=1 Tax=Folsomia candida TaxID=158441 RepID=A0A226D6M3_FOLCA|nr:Matrix metalloproteinase-25 [Folsomia candida]
MRLFALFSIVVLQLFFGPTTHAQLKYARVDTLTDALKYLVQFGYLKNLNEVVSLLQPSFTSFDPRNPAVSAMKIAFTKFQQYAKLPVSGEFDAATKQKMNTPRCGNKDIIQIDGENLGLGNLLRRKKRYVAGAFFWQKRELTYRISKFSETDFSPEVTMREVDRAFELWGNATNLHFVKSPGGVVDIELKFAKSVHGDIEPFDGRGITLAHAFPPGPEIGGDIHFDGNI